MYVVYNTGKLQVKANIHQATLLLATVASNNVASWRQQCCPMYGSDFAMLCVASNMLPYCWQQLQAKMLPSVCWPLCVNHLGTQYIIVITPDVLLLLFRY